MPTPTNLSTILRALPPYFGGKRKMIDHILGQFPSDATIVDIMAGGLNVALAAKASGHPVIANDRMFGPYLIGKALLQNTQHKIDLNTLAPLLEPSTERFITTNFTDVHLPKQLAITADNIRGNIEQLDEQVRWVYRYLLYRFLTHIAPFNLYRYVAFVKQYNEGKEFSTGLQRYAGIWDQVIEDPLPTLRKFAQQINHSVIPGLGVMLNEDLSDFMKRDVIGDVLYIDPPYFGARVKYERGYEVIDQMLARDMGSTHETSDFNSKRKERDALTDVLQYACEYDQTVFSYWTKRHDREWFQDLFDDVGLSATEVPLGDYKYSFSGYIGGTGESSGTIQDKVSGVEILYNLTPKQPVTEL